MMNTRSYLGCIELVFKIDHPSDLMTNPTGSCIRFELWLRCYG